MWKMGTISELCIVEYGTRVVRKNEQRGDYPVYGGGGETFHINRKNRKDRLVIARFAMSEKCTRFVNGDFFLNDSGLTVSPKTKEISQTFLDKIILVKNDDIFALGRGTAQRNLNVDKFKSLSFGYPPLESQHRIVTKLNAFFTKIDDAYELTNAQKVQGYLLRSALLSSSFINISKREKLKLGDICEVRRGTSITKKNTKLGKVPVIGGG